MLNTNAPMTRDGPSGATAPPKPGTRAATGTITIAATAVSTRVAISLPASPRTRKRRYAAVKPNSARRKATPSVNPPRISAADAGCLSSATSPTSTAVDATAATRNGQSRFPAGFERASVSIVVASIIAADGVYDPRPSTFIRSSHLVREDATGRCGSAVHSIIEPAYSLTSLRPSNSDKTNQLIAAQWPVLQSDHRTSG
jgi:hypothetical protein